MSQIIASRIRTPDGTILQSRHRHDYVTHIDTLTGEEYMLDGGTEYFRSNVNKVPAEDISVYMSDRHGKRREAFCWGTRGKDGRQPLVFKPIKDLDTEHINAILETQHHIAPWTRELFQAELDYRTRHFEIEPL